MCMSGHGKVPNNIAGKEAHYGWMTLSFTC